MAMAMAAAIECRILGPLEIEIDGRPVRLGPQQRVVFLALLIARGRVVLTPRLAELLWGPEPPDGAPSTLRSHVHHLRRALQVDGAAPLRLETAPGGYRLEAEPELVDAYRFERLVAASREALRAGDTHSSVDLVRAALGMWRGPALADVAGRPFAAADIARLDGMHRAAQHTRVEALLAIGKHAELVDELYGLLAQQPDDEVLRGHLALALFRSDRLGKALEVCRAGIALARESGLDSRRLTRLQQNILRGAPALEWVPAVRGPHQLPPAIGDFIGRADELALLRGWACSGRLGPRGTTVISAIVGKAGVGKTALALRVAHDLVPHFPDGQLYLDLSGRQVGEPMRTTDALDQLLRALGVKRDALPTRIEEQLACYRSLLADRRVLVVLDAASSADQVRPLLPGSPTSFVLVTSRDTLGGLIVAEGAHPVHLDTFTPDEAVELLARVAGAERVAGEPEAADKIARRCGYLPLAVRLAAAKLAIDRRLSLSNQAAQLGDERQRLSTLTVGDVDIRASLASSFQALTASGRRMVSLLGLMAGPDFSVEAAAALAGSGVDNARALLVTLVEASLLEVAPGSGRYRFHDLVRLYASEQADALRDRDHARRRLAEWYLDSANAAEQVLSMGRPRCALRRQARRQQAGPAGVSQALEWFEIERVNLVAAVRQAAAAAEPGMRSVSWMLADALWYFFRLRKYWADWQDTCQVGLATARAVGDRQAEAWMLSGFGVLLWDVGRHQPAIGYHRHSLALFRQLGDRPGEALALNRLGIELAVLGHHDEAISALRQSLTIRIEVGDRYGQAVALANLGEALQRVGRLDEAVDYQQRALIIQNSIGDLYSAGLTLNNLGEAYLTMERPEPARVNLERALAVHREIRHQWGEALALRNLGRAAALCRNETAAADYQQQALAIFTELDAPPAAVSRATLAGR
jgi:DNA-binding SARP family transcriptional activator